MNVAYRRLRLIVGFVLLLLVISVIFSALSSKLGFKDDTEVVSLFGGTSPGDGGAMTDGACLTNLLAGTPAGTYSNVIITVGTAITIDSLATGEAPAGGAAMTDGKDLTNIWNGITAGTYSNVIITVGTDITLASLATGEAGGGGGGGIALSDVMETAGTTNTVSTWAALTNAMLSLKRNLGGFDHQMFITDGANLLVTSEVTLRGYHNGHIRIEPVTLSTTEGTNRTSSIESDTSGTSGYYFFRLIDNTAAFLFQNIRFMGVDGEIESMIKIEYGASRVSVNYCYFHFNVDHGNLSSRGVAITVGRSGYLDTYQNWFSHLSYAYQTWIGGRIISRFSEDVSANMPRYGHYAFAGGFIQIQDNTLDGDQDDTIAGDGGLIIRDVGATH